MAAACVRGGEARGDGGGERLREGLRGREGEWGEGGMGGGGRKDHGATGCCGGATAGADRGAATAQRGQRMQRLQWGQRGQRGQWRQRVVAAQGSGRQCAAGVTGAAAVAAMAAGAAGSRGSRGRSSVQLQIKQACSVAVAALEECRAELVAAAKKAQPQVRPSACCMCYRIASQMLRLLRELFCAVHVRLHARRVLCAADDICRAHRFACSVAVLQQSFTRTVRLHRSLL